MQTGPGLHMALLESTRAPCLSKDLYLEKTLIFAKIEAKVANFLLKVGEYY